MLDEDSAEVAGIKPKVLLEVGEKRTAKGAAKDPYIQKRRAQGFYSCTCPSWRNSKGLEAERTCSHLKSLLGEAYEAARIDDAKNDKPVLSQQSPGNRKRKEREEFPGLDDSFPHAEGSEQDGLRREKRLQNWNERNTNGPRGLNGGSELLLATKWPEDKDPTGYWISEKLDGVRAWWDGSRMWARSGRPWNPPEWFKQKLPQDMHLDGELWIRRDAFDMTSGLCRRFDNESWTQINFMVFDYTNASLLYEERLKELKRRLPDGEMSPDQVQSASRGGNICVLPAVKCESRSHLHELMFKVLDSGGEGLMLRQPRSKYEFKRSKTLYKYKHWYDAEGLVVGQEYGEGEHKGRMGAVVMEMESGNRLTVGSGFTHAQRDAWQPSVGKIIRYRFQELSHDGLPRFPIYEGVATDKVRPRDAIVRSTQYRAAASLSQAGPSTPTKRQRH